MENKEVVAAMNDYMEHGVIETKRECGSAFKVGARWAAGVMEQKMDAKVRELYERMKEITAESDALFAENGKIRGKIAVLEDQVTILKQTLSQAHAVASTGNASRVRDVIRKAFSKL